MTPPGFRDSVFKGSFNRTTLHCREISSTFTRMMKKGGYSSILNFSLMSLDELTFCISHIHGVVFSPWAVGCRFPKLARFCLEGGGLAGEVV